MKTIDFPCNPKFTAMRQILGISETNDKILLEGLLSYYMQTKPEFKTEEENHIYSQVTIMVQNYFAAKEQAKEALESLRMGDHEVKDE